MKRLLPFLLLASCTDPSSNPKQVWIALDGDSGLKLVGAEPHPF